MNSPHQATPKRLWWLRIAAAAAILGCGVLISRLKQPEEGVATAPSAPAPDAARKPQAETSKGGGTAEVELLLKLAVSKLGAAQSAKSAGDSLIDLRAALGRLPPGEASRVVQEFLNSGADSSTRAPFALGPGGSLASAPTLRSFLLDYLEQIDPGAAARIGREILGKMESADEWALALRSVAKFEPSDTTRDWLASKVRQLLRHEPWLQDPSVGCLEAFDVAVHLGGSSLIPDLTRLLRMTNNQAVAHAAFLAADRLARSDPEPVLASLLPDFDMMNGRESTRAGYFAKADISQAAQRELLEKYLLHPQLGESELEAFADAFPSENSMVSHNLLTETRPRSGAEIRSRDAASLQVVHRWMHDPRFQEIRPQLNSIRIRLEGFLGRKPDRTP